MLGVSTGGSGTAAAVGGGTSVAEMVESAAVPLAANGGAGSAGAAGGSSAGTCCADVVNANASQLVSTQAGKNALVTFRRFPVIGQDPIGRRGERL
jgi:hypothetical protein